METKTNQTNEFLVDDIDDELEDFKEIGGSEILADPDALQWEEDWDVAGWDDEDTDRDFVLRLNEELQRYKASLNMNKEGSNGRVDDKQLSETKNNMSSHENNTKEMGGI